MMLEEMQDRAAAEIRAKQAEYRARLAELIARKGAGAMAAAARAENHKAKTPQNDLGANGLRVALPNKARRKLAATNRNLVLTAIGESPNIGAEGIAKKLGLKVNSVKAYLGWLRERGYIHGVSGNGYVLGERP